MPIRLIVALLSILTAALVAPTAGFAFAGVADKQCYTHFPQVNANPSSEPITVSLNGGTPGATFQVLATVPGGGSGSAGSVTGTFDASGNGIAQLTNVFPPKATSGPIKGQKLRISAKDLGQDVEIPIATVSITNLALSASEKPRNPRKARVVKVSGTPFAGKKLYAFVTSRNGKRVLSRFKLGKANKCGFVKHKAVVAPTPFSYGEFRLYVNAGKRLKRKQSLGSQFRIYRL